MRFEHLPNEILVDIACRLSFDGYDFEQRRYSTRDLYCLSLCSRQLRIIAEAPLYSCFYEHHRTSVALFTRTVLERPRLATMVRKLDLCADEYECTDFRNDPFQSGQFRMALEALSLSEGERAQWDTDVISGHRDARAALLLSLLPNLRALYLQISRPLCYINELMHHIREHQLEPTTGQPTPPVLIGQRTSAFHPMLTCLSEVCIWTETSLNIHEVEPILNAKSLRRFSAEGLGPSRILWQPLRGVSSVQDLELRRCQSSEEEVVAMLQACKTLKRFTYQWDQPWSDDDVLNENWDFGIEIGPLLMEALAPSKETLEELELSGLTPIRNDTMSLGALADFVNLKALRVPSVMILNKSHDSVKRSLIDSLPTAIENLSLATHGLPGEASLASELLRFVQHKERSPALVELAVKHENRFMSSVDSTPDFTLLKAACDGAGISFELESRINYF